LVSGGTLATIFAPVCSTVSLRVAVAVSYVADDLVDLDAGLHCLFDQGATRSPSLPLPGPISIPRISSGDSSSTIVQLVIVEPRGLRLPPGVEDELASAVPASDRGLESPPERCG
jgi:hypothetical protein